jgi:hypothetical protein
MIAHVCAYLLGFGHVPDELAVVMPDLEAAVIALLAGAPDRELERTGGSR